MHYFLSISVSIFYISLHNGYGAYTETCSQRHADRAKRPGIRSRSCPHVSGRLAVGQLRR